MTYIEFRDTNMNKYLDWDGQYGPQCWDLAQCYVTQCLDVPGWVLSGCNSAKNLMYEPKVNDVLQYFYEVPVNAMQQGDLCVWDWHDPNRPDGHVAVFDNWDGEKCWYFSQNPGPAHLEVIDGGTMKAFRRITPQPIVPTVPRDTTKDQIEVIVDNLNVRTSPSIEGNKIGFAPMGIYNYYEVLDNDGYTWYKIADLEWIASSDEWTKVYPKEQPTTPPTQPPEEYIKLKVLDRKDGNVLVDLPVWIKE